MTRTRRTSCGAPPPCRSPRFWLDFHQAARSLCFSVAVTHIPSTNLYLLPVSETPASRVLLFTFSPPRWHLRRCGLCTHSVSQHRSFFLKRRFAPGGELHLISESLRSPFRLTRQCWRPAPSRWRTRLTASSFAAQLLDGGERELEPLGRKQCVHLLGCERSIRALQLMDSDECCRPPRMPPLW